jgi:hypothetical protein
LEERIEKNLNNILIAAAKTVFEFSAKAALSTVFMSVKKASKQEKMTRSRVASAAA